jgi:hypothetical protein
VHYSDHYEEKGVFERLMTRLRNIMPGAQGYTALGASRKAMQQHFAAFLANR